MALLEIRAEFEGAVKALRELSAAVKLLYESVRPPPPPGWKPPKDEDISYMTDERSFDLSLEKVRED